MQNSKNNSLVYEQVGDIDAFYTFKIRKAGSEEYTIAAIFKIKKVNRQNIESLNATIKKYNQEATGLYLDISVVDSIAPNVLEFSVDMIGDLGSASSVARVGICAGRFTTLAFKTLMKIKKPKVLTKVFDKDEPALNFALNVEPKK